MEFFDNENQNKHLKYLFGLEENEQSNFFEKIQKKYWENLTPANDNSSNKGGDNE